MCSNSIQMQSHLWPQFRLQRQRAYVFTRKAWWRSTQWKMEDFYKSHTPWFAPNAPNSNPLTLASNLFECCLYGVTLTFAAIQKTGRCPDETVYLGLLLICLFPAWLDLNHYGEGQLVLDGRLYSCVTCAVPNCSGMSFNLVGMMTPHNLQHSL